MRSSNASQDHQQSVATSKRRTPSSPRRTLFRLREKLHPANFPVSPKMAAIMGYVLGEPFADPPILEMAITSDGFALARVGDQTGMDTFIGTYADLFYNFLHVCQIAELTPDEHIEAICRFAALVGIYGAAAA